MLALTVKQPWAWAIVAGLKDVENRSWRTSHHGPLLIHAGRRSDPAGFGRLAEAGIEIPELEYGGIIGRVDVVGCVRDSRSPWAAAGQYHWQLRDARTLPFEALRGHQTLFSVGPRDQQTLGL